ncbi:MAG: hypothetical protein AB7O28_00520 [Vicinamibacterales bacterium]
MGSACVVNSPFVLLERARVELADDDVPLLGGHRGDLREHLLDAYVAKFSLACTSDSDAQELPFFASSTPVLWCDRP